MIAAVCIGLLVIAVIAYYFKNSTDAANVNRIMEERQKTEKDNWNLAKEKMELADSIPAGSGARAPTTSRKTSLQAPFASDDTVYNAMDLRPQKERQARQP